MSKTYTNDPVFRIGAVSKTTGIPVSTLRIWEIRYGAFSPEKSTGNQRFYREQDVSKALLLKQLVSDGHAISAIAHLDLDDLRRMCNLPNQSHYRLDQSANLLSLAVVGLGMANRIESKNFALGVKQKYFKVTDVFPDLSEASTAFFKEIPQVLLIKVTTLHKEIYAAIQAVIQKNRFLQTIVIYHFAAQSLVQSMKLSGMMVRREPISDIELVELIHSVVLIDKEQTPKLEISGTVIPNRKYSDSTLSYVASISTNVLCECPRHVAELISQLASFEEYSQECLNQNPADAQLHAYLRSISGSARFLFENALEKIATHEGIDLSGGRK